MVKLVDMPDLGSGAARRVGSSPITRTKKSFSIEKLFLFILFWLSRIIKKVGIKIPRLSMGLLYFLECQLMQKTNEQLINII